MRALSLLALAAFAATASAQGTKAPATKSPAPATKAAAPATKGPAPAPQTTAPAPQGPGPQRRPALTIAPEVAPSRPPTIMREVFDYESGGRRDPFFSLLTTSDLRPTVADLNLIVVLLDQTGRRPVAVMRDIDTKVQYRVTTGMTLGRMRVVEIKRRAVIFSIEEYGLNRLDSIILGDTTKARK